MTLARTQARRNPVDGSPAPAGCHWSEGHKRKSGLALVAVSTRDNSTQTALRESVGSWALRDLSDPSQAVELRPTLTTLAGTPDDACDVDTYLQRTVRLLMAHLPAVAHACRRRSTTPLPSLLELGRLHVCGTFGDRESLRQPDVVSRAEPNKRLLPFIASVRCGGARNVRPSLGWLCVLAEAVMTAVSALSASAAENPPEINDLLRRLVEVSAEHLSVAGAGVMLANPSGLDYIHAHAGTETDLRSIERVEKLQELLQVGPCNEAFTFEREVVIDDLTVCTNESWRTYLAGAGDVGLRSVVAIPLIGRGRAWGVLDLYRDVSGSWNAQDLAAARLLSAVAVSYLVMAGDRDDARSAQQQLAHRNLHDQLTGLPNRALLFDRLGHALHRAARHDRTVAAFFIDMDHFKYINDTYGHAAGDAVLTEVTRRMTTTLRAEDTLARLSGDEFVLVCEDLPQRSEHELDSQLNAVVARLQLALAEPIEALGTRLSAAASIGVALSTPGTSADDLLADADAAMYRVKQRRAPRTSARPQSGGRSIRDLERDLSMALRPRRAARALPTHCFDANEYCRSGGGPPKVAASDLRPPGRR